MIIERTAPSGAIVIYSTIDGYLKTRSYYGYSKAEAVESYASEFGISEDELPELTDEDYLGGDDE